MSNKFTELPFSRGGGSKMDETGVVDGDGRDLRRVRTQVAGSSFERLADVVDEEPAAEDYGVVARVVGAAKETTLALVQAAVEAVRDRLPASLTPSGNLKVAIEEGSVTIGADVVADQGDPGSTPWPVTVDSSALPAGAATQSTLASVLAEVTGVALDATVAAGNAVLLSILGGLGDVFARQADGSQVTQVSNFPSSQAVTGPLTDTQLRASAVSADVTDRAARLLGVLSTGSNIIGKVGLDAANLAGIALDATVAAVRDRLPAALTAGGGVKVGVVDALPAGSATIGKVDQGTGGASAWKVDGSAVTQPVSAAVLPLPAGASTRAAQTDGTQKAIARGGAKGASAAADVTSTAEGADHQALDVQLYHGGVAKDPTAIRALAVTTDAVTARDDYDDQESLADQSGAGAVLTFSFVSTKVALAIVTSQGTGLVSRATAGSTDTPTASRGQPCFDGAPTYLPVRCGSVKVFAPALTTVSVVGLIRN